MDREELFDRLEGAGLASRADMDRAVAEARTVSPEEALVGAGLVDETALARLLADAYALPLADLSGELPAEAVTSIPQEVAENHCLIPIARDDLAGVLTLAMADPVDVVAEDVVRFMTRMRVERVVATRTAIREAIERHYGRSPVGSLLNRLPSMEEVEVVQKEEGEAFDGDEVEEVHAGPIVQLVNALILDAIQLRASDIHVEPDETTMRVRYRVDGLLRTIAEMPRRLQRACIARFKLMAGMDITETRRPQDGRARVRTDQGLTDIRVSTLPGLVGEKVVCRLLRRGDAALELDDLGFLEEDFHRIQSLLRSPQGMLLVTGPTGSGKTTTIYALLNRLNVERINILTVEDPVEYQLRGIHQVQVHPKAGLHFADVLRSMLRQDPDVIMVGEIRDAETAHIALEAAQTGHFVLSTLHTNDAPSAVVRLLQMGLPAHLVSSSLLGVVAQRLVRRLCPECRRPGTPDADTVRFLAEAGGIAVPEGIWEPAGCEACGFTGYRRRVGVYEILTMTDHLRELVAEGVSTTAFGAAARAEGMSRMLEDGLRKVAQGDTSLEEVLRVAPVDRKAGRPCPSCSHPLESDWRVCPQCSEVLAPGCPGCGGVIQPEWSVCPRCQRSLREPAPAGPTPLPPAPEHEAPEDDTPRVLVVDDDPGLLRAVGLVLKDEGYHLFQARDGAEGLELAHRHRPHLILTDLEMPGMDGLELIRRLRSQLRTSLIPVIVLTSRSDDEGELMGLEAGADDYLVKPVTPARLRARVAAALRQRA